MLGRTCHANCSYLVTRCPSDIAPTTAPSNSGSANGTAALAVTSYAGVLGSFDGQWCQVSGTTNVEGVRNHGLLVVNSTRKIAEVTDGTSNVFAVGEVSWRPVNAAGDGSDRQYILGNITNGGGPLCTNSRANNSGRLVNGRKGQLLEGGTRVPLIGN